MDTLNFIGRKEELALFAKTLDSKRFSATLLYGRRRVGKTELIRQSLKNRKDRIVPFVASKTTYGANFLSLVDAVSAAYDLPLKFKDLKELLAFLGERSKTEKTIFVLDEYSFFRKDDGSTDSDFQHFIDDYQHESQLSLIFSGSIVRIMKGLIDGAAPLYGRFENVISLLPFDYRESSRFFPERTPEEKFFLYACLGGIPHYLLMVDPAKSAEANVISLFFGINSALKSEADNLLNDELSSIENASAVLALIGSKRLHYSDINQLFPSRSGNGATYILKKLLEMGLLRKTMALNGKDERNSSYEIADPFLRFYYAFYVPTRSYSFLYSPEDLYRRFVKEKLEDSFLPHSFEEVAKEFLILENKAGRIEPPLLGVGSYAYSEKASSGKWVNAEFDVVSKDEKGLSDYECKYRLTPVGISDLEEGKASLLRSKISFYRIGFFSRSGFEPSLLEEKNILLYSLEDLYR